METYLESLQMKAFMREFHVLDVPRISQLINKSNQFNLTTRRRTEAEVKAVLQDPAYFHFTVRLTDRFGDYGLIAAVIGELMGNGAEIDTWLMSCRVLQRQLEEEVFNEIVRVARIHKCSRIRGVYRPTARNHIVRGLYPALGFKLAGASEDRLEFELNLDGCQFRPSHICIAERSYAAR
jgi:FkbH-like protein